MNREIGALLSLQPNASKIATNLGLDPFLASKGPMVDKAFRIYNLEGKKQMEIPSNLKKYGADRVIYHRVDLHDALKQACTSTDGIGKPVQIIPSSRVISCDPEKGIVSLDNETSYQGDLLVGADGIHSVLRDAVVGEGVSQPKPTGISAYRLLLETSELEKLTSFTSVIDPRDPATTMIVGHDRRIIMGPGRNGTLYGVVALVPDEYMHETTNAKSWTSEGDVKKLLESYAEFPVWIKDLLQLSSEPPALYQLRDIDPLESWIRGRTILIGDAAHAMLPTQGQGASQSFEDAEALQAFFNDITVKSSEEELRQALQDAFKTRYARASLIQAYSRQQARPGTDKGSLEVKLNPGEFLDYNCNYDGAKHWRQRMIAEENVEALETSSQVDPSTVNNPILT
jgi:salicylate hydroxylase